MAIVSILKDGEALAAAAAERVTSLIQQSIAERGHAVVCLTGGRTPRRLYELLADASRPWRARIAWTRVHAFWGDERHVPPDHAESNFGMAHRALLAHVPIPGNHVHRMRGELPSAAAAAREYETALRQGFELAGRTDQTFDVMLLGLGEDAHIASIFPGHPLLEAGREGPPYDNEHGGRENERVGPAFTARQDNRVAAVWAERLDAWRITLTPPALLDARAILMLVSGDDKTAAVRAALDAPIDEARWPAQILRAADDRVEWIMDAAAARLRGAPPA
ncbi:MAG: pgl [Acidobacteria bacterium]|nr:pgl [Acidobacteriota bacterium]